MTGKPVKWETTVKTYDSAGELVTETTTTVVQVTPPGEAPSVGFYL